MDVPPPPPPNQANFGRMIYSHYEFDADDPRMSRTAECVYCHVVLRILSSSSGCLIRHFQICSVRNCVVAAAAAQAAVPPPPLEVVVAAAAAQPAIPPPPPPPEVVTAAQPAIPPPPPPPKVVAAAQPAVLPPPPIVPVVMGRNIYEHFHEAYSRQSRRRVAKCVYCGRVLILGDSASTSTLRRHVRRCVN